MKRMKHILNGFIALAMVLMFTQCTDNKANEQGASTPAVVGGPVNMKIAYVEIDSLLTKYRFASRERAEQENLRISQKQRDLQQLQEKLTSELQAENQKISLQLRDSINSFLKIYNKDKGYSLIISNTGFDNLLYADPAFNITQEIVDGLNARYNPASSKK